MAKNNICGDCHHFSDVGKCRISSTSKREYCAFFAEACPLFTKEPEDKPKPEMKLKVLPNPEKAGKTTKTCKVCGRELPLGAFGNNRFGKLSTCRECRCKIQKEAWEKRHPKKEPTPVQEYKVKPKEDPKPIEPKRPALTPEEVETHKQDAIQMALSFASDQELADELTRRGYRGHLSKTIIDAE